MTYSSLAAHLKRPNLYERTTRQFWNDPYIATQMLDAHLNPNTDAASRNPAFITRCADFVASQVPPGASLLDIGCGPGLYTTQFAKRGLRVTGLDFSKNSIDYAKAHDSGSKYVLGDYLAMDFENAFDVITLIWCDYGALIPGERRELLKRVAKALKPDGLFMLDMFTTQNSAGKQENTTWAVHPHGGFWSPTPHICMNAQYLYGDTAEASRTVVITDEDVRCFNIWNCYFTKQTLLDEVAAFGFAEHGFYGDLTGAPYVNGTEIFCAILKLTHPGTSTQ